MPCSAPPLIPASTEAADTVGRELRRLLIAPGRLPARGRSLELLPGELHYLVRVLRLRPGDRFALSDGAGRLWTACLAAGRAELEQPRDTPRQRQDPPAPRLALAVALPRRDGEVLARMVCELGIDALIPLQAEWAAAGERLKPPRLATILREAAEQCERLWLPELLPPQAARALFEPASADLALLASTREAQLPLLDEALARAQPPAGERGWLAPGASVTLAIGPEGGWSEVEHAAALAAGWIPVSLGPTILRVSTAAVVGTAALVRWRLGLTGPPGSPCPPGPWPSP